MIKLWNIDSYQWMYVNFSIFFSMLQVHAIIFWDLSTWKCVISKYRYMYVKLRYIPAQKAPFLEFHIPNFVHILYIIIYMCLYIYKNISFYLKIYLYIFKVLKAELCFHRYVHFTCVSIYILGFQHKECASD